jgi:hypothetical protein
MNARQASAAIVTVLVLLPSVAWAEVMDKEPTLSSIWGWALVLGVMGFFAWRRHFALGAFITLLAAVQVWSFHLELADPYVGPAILHEAGRSYVVQAYTAMAVCGVLHLGGLTALLRRRHRLVEGTA